MTADEIEQVSRVFSPLGDVSYSVAETQGELRRFWTITGSVTGAWLTSFSCRANADGDEAALAIVGHPKPAIRAAKRSITAMQQNWNKVHAAALEDSAPLGR